MEDSNALTRRGCLRDPIWQGISAIVGVLGLFVGAWQIYLAYNPPGQSASVSPPSPTVETIVQATGTAIPTSVVSSQATPPVSQAKSELCITTTGTSPTVYGGPCTPEEKALFDKLLPISIGGMLVIGLIMGIIWIYRQNN